jgi:DNA (cytosine-5)-methyltransferase 1
LFISGGFLIEGNPTLKLLDLFCGAGGFSAGFSPYSLESHVGIDLDPFASQTFTQNYPHSRALTHDISQLHSTEIESTLGGKPTVIIASPPCEEFSRANPKSTLPATQRIYGDGTARLLLDTIRIIGDLSPTVFIIENVVALLQQGGKEIVIQEFERVGIDDIYFNIIRAHKHGNPSKRIRLFISNLRLKLPQHAPLSVIDVIGDLPPLDMNALLNPGTRVPNHEFQTLTNEKQKQVRKTAWGRGTRYFKVSHKKSLVNWVRLHPNQIATSIIGNSRYIHPYENRLLTVREHARLMSYSDSFIFTGPSEHQYQHVRESVAAFISHHIAEEVKAHLE